MAEQKSGDLTALSELSSHSENLDASLLELKSSLVILLLIMEPKPYHNGHPAHWGTYL